MNKIKIYQLSHSTDYLFMDYEFAKKHNFNLKDYKLVYEFTNDSDSDIDIILEKVFVDFNIHRPNDFKGHSLSVSDIVKLNNKLYYVDSIGFKEIK